MARKKPEAIDKPAPKKKAGRKRRYNPKSSKPEMSRRYRLVEELVGKGWTASKIIGYLTGKHTKDCKTTGDDACKGHLGVDGRQIERYIQVAYKRLEEHNAPFATQRRTQIMEMLHQSYAMAFTIGDFRGAGKIAMDIARMAGLLQPEVPSNIINMINGIPSDAERFPGDQQYQTMAAMKQMLSARAALGDVNAARASAQVSRAMVREFGVSRSGMANNEEKDLIKRARARVIQNERFGGEVLEPITKPVNDFANLETPAKPGTSEQ